MAHSKFQLTLKSDENGIYYFGDYIPKVRGGSGDKYSKLVLGLKKREKNAIDYFNEVLSEYFMDCIGDPSGEIPSPFHDSYKIMEEGTLTTHVPSSTKGKTETGINDLLIRVNDECCDTDPFYYNSPKAFIRHKSIAASHSGGDRTIKAHLDSISMDMNADATSANTISFLLHGELHKEYHRGKLLIIDDVTTSGSSLLTCRKIAIRNGYSDISLLALGKTKYE